MSVPNGHVRVVHGSLAVNVPCYIFKGPGIEPHAPESTVFRTMLQKRYPWLTEDSVDVLMEKARRQMVADMDEKTHGRSLSKVLESEGRTDEAISHLKRHLERDSNDADSWYALGELLFKAGRADEGYRAFARGRELF
ncbi:MAG: tetratricopeptide repeat protein [Candidatus Methanoplasma sp.]|jgi:tetratricopeptide (TPR) repeat protein|nr:tetratricopeptide repeat protein [Candidatus Methanoplasma sp.]